MSVFLCCSSSEMSICLCCSSSGISIFLSVYFTSIKTFRKLCVDPDHQADRHAILLEAGEEVPLLLHLEGHLSSKTHHEERDMFRTSGNFVGARIWNGALSAAFHSQIDATGFDCLASGLFTATSIYHSVSLRALMERWIDTTHTFHLPVGELTTAPLDFLLITGMTFGGSPVPFDGGLGFYDQRDAYIFEMLGFVPEMKGRSLRQPKLYNRYKESFPRTSNEVDLIARAFFCYLLGSTLFCRSGATLPLYVMPTLEDLDAVSSYD
ncbi:protein MAINTENANCE OF MERISTEMS-like [Mercurialis annua]|uniref:protein MAINTENANCE OF MERISTEMS-like n=1 Tax=Mercurialis annua TaxID=3986 RepID=UPI0024AE6D71|nr:protein MAINTENANCE OF MERISTEMS-like [Mercurialis annua]